jgi:hypothetical protein
MQIVMAGPVPAIHGLSADEPVLPISRAVIPDKPRSGAIRNPCRSASEELP